MRLSLVQITVGPHIDKNFQKVDKFINQALSFDPDLILLPECFLFLSNLKKTSFTMDHDYILHYQKFTKINKVNLLLGSLPILDKGKVYNRSILINQEGSISSYYDKIHMFDVILKNNEEYRESDTYTPGSSLKSMKINGDLIGHSICYDLRFPKLFRELSKKSCKAIVVPSAFTYTTGKAHWHCLLRARAIENSIFIVAPNQCGTNEENRSTYGHSLVVNPWGEIISEATDSEMVLNCEIDLKSVEKYQNSIPVLKHDRNFN
jgi:predicted amidohydrolase